MFTLVVVLVFHGGFDTRSESTIVVPGFASESLCKTASEKFNKDVATVWCFKTK